MNDSEAPSPFESFNARLLDFEQVAESFVPPQQFSLLVRRSNTLMVGPRGSGKTTLLKMLHQRALAAWQHPDAEKFRRRVDFVGVFIPTDVSWGAQLAVIGGQDPSSEHLDLFGLSAFTTHVLRSFVASLEEQVQRARTAAAGRLNLGKDEESAIALDVAQAWHLPIKIPSLAALRYSLSERLHDLWQAAHRELLLGPAGRAGRLAELPYIHLSFLESCSLVLDRIGELEGHQRCWAMLFDELELAPEIVREKILAAVRNADSRFLFKLALSPYNEKTRFVESADSAMEGHDYESVSLTYAHKEDAYEFSRELTSAIFRRQNLSEDPYAVLGPSAFDADRTERGYGRDSRQVMMFENLAQKDASFANYLTARGINIYQLADMTERERAADVRKIVTIATVRNEFRASDRQQKLLGRRVRARKSRALYAGATSLFALTEGNPRWLIALMSNLVQASEGGVISPEVQGREIDKAVTRFRALLRTIPLGGNFASKRGVLSILDSVGEAFFDAVVVADFRPDPAGTFIVDSHTDAATLEAIGKALNSGAIVYVPDARSAKPLGSPRGSRFRLSYLLGAYYKLPPILLRGVSLQLLLSKQDIDAPSLFEGREQ